MEDCASLSKTPEPLNPEESCQATAIYSSSKSQSQSSDHTNDRISNSTVNYAMVSMENIRSKSVSPLRKDTLSISNETKRPRSMPAADQLPVPSIDIDRMREVGGKKTFCPGENRTKVLINVFENSLYSDFRDPTDASSKSKPKLPAKTITSTISSRNVDQKKEQRSKSDKSESRTSSEDLSHLLTMKTFSNSVDVQINEIKYFCSGAILASQSPVFHYQLSKGASMIVLEGLKIKRGEESNVEECLLLLYGGGVVLSDRNIPTIIRFSVLYQVENMYRLALEWVRNCVSVANVYQLWLLGSEPVVKEKRKRKKNDLLHICKHFVRGKEVEIAFELRKVKERGEEVREEFVFMMLQYTDCASVINDLL